MQGFATLLSLVLLSGCAYEDARTRAIVNVFTSADDPLIRNRPALVEGKYRAMGDSLYAFYRGSMPLYRLAARDPAQSIGRTMFPSDALVVGHGDAHLENFGTLRNADGVLALEPNDFDSADRLPYHFDLRRLTTALVLACRLSNSDDGAARAAAVAASEEVVREAARAYAAEMHRFAEGAAVETFVEEEAEAALIRDLFRRSRRDEERRDELDELTMVEDGRRRLLRGVLDPDDPEDALLDLPRFTAEELDSALDEYRRSLTSPPTRESLQVLDAVQQLGGGVASQPRLRLLILVRGETDSPDDDLILELKELADSGVGSTRPPHRRASSVQERIMLFSRLAWATPEAEPYWGVSRFLGLPVQVRLEAEMHKTLRVARLVEREGRPGEIVELGRQLARLLARIHSRGIHGEQPGRDVAASFEGSHEAFAQHEADVALEYADRVEEDFALFRIALETRGPLLGTRSTDAFRRAPALHRLFNHGIEAE